MKKFYEKEIKNKMRELFAALMGGDHQEFKSAKKEIEKLWHADSKIFSRNAHIALEYLPKFDEIKKAENRAAFASGLSLFFLVLADEHFSELKGFTLKVIEHSDGHVREAIRKTADWLYVSLTSRAEPFIYPEEKEMAENQKIQQQKAREQYVDLVKEIKALIDKYDDEADDIEYIDEMKPSVNKSLQLFWSRLTDSPVYRRIMEQSRPVPYEIFIKRKEIENELAGMLEEAKSDFGVEDIKEIIYNEDGQDSLIDVIAMFDTGQGATELGNIMDMINDAWNYFPHKILDGLSPAEKLLGYRDKQCVIKGRNIFP